MKTYKIIMMSMLPLFLLVASCEKDLNLTPESVIGANSYWKNQGDVESYVNGMYVRLRSDANDNLFFWGEARSEVLSYGLQASEGRERYFENTLDRDAAGPDWKNLYTVIHDANLIIKYAPSIDFDSEANKNIALAQAHAMRAYCYFIIAKVWGDAPVNTEPTEGFDPVNSFKARDNVSEVMNLVKSDVDAALGLFPDNTFSNGRSQWSKPSVNALKGEVYLWTGKLMGGGTSDITTALTALESVHSADVELLSNYDEIFRYSNKGNREILMAIHYEDLESGNNFNDGMYIRGDQIPANGDPAAKALLGEGGGLNRWAPSELFRNQWADDDTRKNATFVLMNTENPDNAGVYDQFYASAVLKYRGFVDAGTRKYMDDVILYRYADVLLMIAEAKNALNQDPTDEMNLIRQRAYGANYPGHEFINGTMEENDDAILQERLFELSFEGKRWYDLLRFEKAFELVPTLVGESEHKKLFPISQGTINLNGLIEQNPGY
ncbi:RagB/SusD family nutrient uptake outer membrane protein [Arenibacter aquaticus]|uniref:RagB/SusD family nutrient uptake outer membrane protein n=1 Tax=Arenibacter aquaticus TaxID=2489054 RepID=A0A3S0CPB7_9FLAO|nr:RagB/SusD family nutrient uptake outer membrane protein [Arenibacter aquaticus]RTE54101.1 RagB/SusD family nutrient uptake outer membrane protein [Arenibacter aquaticus]